MESCRAPTLLAELEDDDEMPDEDENDDDENEDDDDYEEVMVSRNLLSFMVNAFCYFISLRRQGPHLTMNKQRISSINPKNYKTLYKNISNNN